MTDVVTQIIDDHYRKSNAEFWWAEADRAKAEMLQAESELSYVWARDRLHAALWNAVEDRPKLTISTIWINGASKPATIEVIYR